jgi:hypothetical protein
VNNVKVLLPPTEPIKSDLSNQSHLFRFPPDLPTETLKQAEYHTLNPELVEAILRHGTLSIIGMAIAPVLRIQDGLATGSLPTRNHLFSPAIALPDGRLVLQYNWLFADILWYPGDLVIDEETARRFAEADIQVLRLGIEAGHPQQDFYGNPFETVSRQLLLVCQSFEKLLNNPDTVESHVQAFLENPAHYFLIDPAHQEILPRKKLGGGKYITDFTVLRADGEYHFIEIENPQREIYQPSRQEQSAHLTHAIGQVQDWLRYVNDNRDSVRREDSLSTIYEPTGEVIAGRDAHLGDTAALRFRFLRSETSHIKLRTYDMLLEDARAYARTLYSLGSSPQDLGR